MAIARRDGNGFVLRAHASRLCMLVSLMMLFVIVLFSGLFQSASTAYADSDSEGSVPAENMASDLSSLKGNEPVVIDEKIFEWGPSGVQLSWLEDVISKWYWSWCDFESEVVPPTCDGEGYTIHTSKMSIFYKDGDWHKCWYKDMKTAAFGHHYVDIAIAQPTCESGGYIDQRCTYCGRTQRIETPALGHRYEDDSVIPPTCEKDGCTIQKCANCGVIKEVPGEKAFGHSWADPVWKWSSDYSSAIVSSTCAHDGSHTRSATAAVAHEMTETYVKHTATAELGGQTYVDTVEVALSNPVDPDPPKPDDPIIPDDPTPIPPTPDDPTPSVPDDQTPSEPTGGVTVTVDPTIEPGFSATLEGAPAGPVALSVHNVTEGPIFDAFAATVSASASEGDGKALEIVGVFDIDLSINGKAYSENFGTLTLELPIGNKYNYKWTTIYHCHGNDPNNITSYERIITRDGKAVLSGVTKLSQFAVAVGDSALKRPVALNVKRPVAVFTESPVAISFASPDTKGDAAPASAVVRHVRAIATGENVYDNVYASMPAASPSPSDKAQPALALTEIILASIAVMSILTVLLIVLRKRREDID